MSNTVENIGPIKLISSPGKPEFALAQYPADKVANDDLKNTFGRENVTFKQDDPANKFYAIRFTGKTNYDTLKAFAERHAPRLVEREQSFKNATTFADQFKDAFPGIRLDVRQGNLAIFMPQQVDAVSMMGATWKKETDFEYTNKQTGEVSKAGGYWSLTMSDKVPALHTAGGPPSVQAALTIASSEIAERTHSRELAAGLKSPHEALQFSVKGSMLSVVSPRDPVLSEALKKDAGMQWQPQASVWRTQVTDANVGKLTEVFTKLGSYLDGQALQATPTERGLTSNEIAALEKTPQPNGTPLDEKSMRHVENAMQLVARTFTPTELADMRDMKAGEHQQSSSPRLAALSNDTFNRVTKAVETAQTAYQAVNGMKFDAAAAKIAQMQAPAQVQGQAVQR
jgi:hypothetical protein